MKKNIIITSGPTNERIDSVMKITNMSTGALGSIVADRILTEESESLGNLYYLSPKLAYKPKVQSDSLKIITIESTLDLLEELKRLLTTEKIDGVVHSSAVGDYYGEYAITGELLAEEIVSKIFGMDLTEQELKNIIIRAIENPTILTDSAGKISSYEKNLMVKLGLTPKVIGHIKEYSPETKLIGFKLLDGVSKEELYEVAHKLLVKNNADYIVANDLSTIGGGKHPATIIDSNGVYSECSTKNDIAREITKILFR
jgi:Phosphopantothenoylcysteine synthetase/decarboxylase